MSKPVAVIHPDHLLDRARRGPSRWGETPHAPRSGLSPAEWRDLGAHLAGCPGCAWEQAAVDDFAREKGSFDDLDPARLDRLVGGALARAGLEVDADKREAPPKPARSPRLGRWLAAAMVAAALVAALVLPTRGDPSPSVTPSDASLDAGAFGSPSAGDS